MQAIGIVDAFGDRTLESLKSKTRWSERRPRWEQISKLARRTVAPLTESPKRSSIRVTRVRSSIG